MLHAVLCNWIDVSHFFGAATPFQFPYFQLMWCKYEIQMKMIRNIPISYCDGTILNFFFQTKISWSEIFWLFDCWSNIIQNSSDDWYIFWMIFFEHQDHPDSINSNKSYRCWKFLEIEKIDNKQKWNFFSGAQSTNYYWLIHVEFDFERFCSILLLSHEYPNHFSWRWFSWIFNHETNANEPKGISEPKWKYSNDPE